MGIPHRFALLTDLHLSDRTDTAAYHALQWAVGQVNRERPDFLAVGGDITTFGTAGATARFLEAINRVEVPVFFTPGNAELRRPEALPLLRALLVPERRYALRGDLLVLLPDTATGTLPEAERAWMDGVVEAHIAVPRRVVITHYPVDKLDRESGGWLAEWLSRRRVELLTAGHIHFHRTRRVNGCPEIVTRGLDPDKASGDLPGLSLFESERPGAWSERFLPWSPEIRLLPADLRDPAGAGVRVAVENIHNPPGTPMDAPERAFATRIDEYLRWIEAMARRFSDVPGARVGAHLDVGHARNNGGDLDNLHPLGDWYACLGRRILGYHIHQVDTDPETRRLSNHREIAGLFSPRISYAGFLWAWSTHQITRGPLFVEVTDEEGRRRTVERLKGLFENAHRIREAVDLRM